MMIFQPALISATFLCSLVAGFLFAFAVVAMPGISQLGDREFIRAFQVMDRVIQGNQPIFMIVWVGSVLTLITAAVLGFGQLAGVERVLILSAAILYIVGVQVPTMTINIPLNNEIQQVDVDTTSASAQQEARQNFEPRWNRWNAFRALASCLASILLIVLVFRL